MGWAPGEERIPDMLQGLIIRRIQLGGMTKDQLLKSLHLHGVQLNQAALDLFASAQFQTRAEPFVRETLEASVQGMGFVDGATFPDIRRRAADLGWLLCPLELGPHWRLQFLDQPEGSLGFAPTKSQAPPGSITVVSDRATQAPEAPLGFYLRRINGVLWLRGYHCDDAHLWSSTDRLLFCRAGANAGETEARG